MKNNNSNKKIVLRKCIACNENKDKCNLIRIVKNKENDIKIDYSGKLDGRGAYICKEKSCITTTIDNRLLNRHLRTNVNNKIYEELETM